ncbi:MAG: N-acetylglucosamine-6-phosphate deacetylase [Ignavibacteriales bacterium]
MKTRLLIRNGQVITPGGVRPGEVAVTGGAIAEIRECGAAADGAAAGDAAAADAGAADARGGPVVLDAGGAFVAPGFLDLHVHGAAGGDAMSGDPESVRLMARNLAKWGTTAFCPATEAAQPAELLRAVESCGAAVDRSLMPGWGGAQVLGVHIEGPYLNPIRRGAQPLECLRAPDLGETRELYAAARGAVSIVSLAPELPGAIPVIEWLAGQGVRVSAAHSDATWEECERGADAGVDHATHLFNGMRPMHHREPGVAGFALADDRIWVEIICDGHHVHPGMIRVAWGAKGPERLGVVSDLTAISGLPDGVYLFAGHEVILSNGTVTTRDGGNLAGSAMPACRVFANLLSWGFSPVEASALMSLNPARHLGLDGRKGSVEAGKDADITIIRADGTVLATIAGGEVVHEADGVERLDVGG